MNQYKFKITSLPKNEVEIEAEIEASLLENAKKKAIKKINEKTEIDGFRKGNAPEDIIIEKLGSSFILEEAADLLLQEYYPQIIKETKLDIIGRPSISIIKLALGNPLQFKIKASTLPEIKLPNYKKIAGKINAEKDEEPTVTEKEVNDVVLQIRKNKAHFDWHKKNKDADHRNYPDLEKEENLPILDDNFAREAGNFKNLAEMKEKIRENIITDKKLKALEKKRGRIIDTLVKETNFEVPDILIESEISKYIDQMKNDIEKVGGKFDEYLSHIKKTPDDLRKEWRELAEKKAKIQLIFNKIAETEKLEPKKEVLENEVKQILEHYPSSNEENARIYVSTILLNSEVLRLLESQKARSDNSSGLSAKD